MRYAAQSTCWEDATEYTVKDAVFQSNRLLLGWAEEGSTGHLDVSSSDGVTFRGNFGYPRPDEFRHAEFTLGTTATGELLFVGRWWRTDSDAGGDWVIRLTPIPSTSTGDDAYTAERDQLFAGLSVSQIADAIRRDAGMPPPADAEPGR